MENLSLKTKLLPGFPSSSSTGGTNARQSLKPLDPWPNWHRLTALLSITAPKPKSFKKTEKNFGRREKRRRWRGGVRE
jgi:hypothetical protein